MSTLPPESTTTVVPDGRRRDPTVHQRGCTDGARTLDDELGSHEQHDHRVGDLVLADRDDLVDVPL